MDREQLSHELRRRLTTLHLLFANFAQAWHDLVSMEFGQNDFYHDEYWAKLDSQPRQKAETAAYKMLLQQLRSEHTETLTDIIHAAATRSATAEGKSLAYLSLSLQAS